MGTTILNDFRFAYLMANILKNIPYILSINQCFVITSKSAGTKHINGNTTLSKVILVYFYIVSSNDIFYSNYPIFF